MATASYKYEPDYAIPPGWILEERLDARQMSQAEFARRCGRSPKLISDIIAGKSAIQPRTAIQFQRVLGVDARIWLGIDSDYRLHREREAESLRVAELADWTKKFPVNELVKREAIAKPASAADRVSALLSFFGVASVEAWQSRYQNPAVAYRHSLSFKSDEFALATWLRLGEIEAEQAECADYDQSKFKRALTRIRQLTSAPTGETISDTRRLCLESGVILAVIKPLPKTALIGVSRWTSSRRALIQLSARHMSDDHLWFSLFHEAAHILLHGRRDIFVHDATKGKFTELDVEANQWAASFLIPETPWQQFIDSPSFSNARVLDFAEEQGIAPGIVVGRLQHEGRIPWSNLNGLKVPLEW